MASATLTRPDPGPDPAGGRGRRRITVPALALAVLALATFVGFLVYPTYPDYDSLYSLLWGRELLPPGAASSGLTPTRGRLLHLE